MEKSSSGAMIYSQTFLLENSFVCHRRTGELFLSTQISSIGVFKRNTSRNQSDGQWTFTSTLFASLINFLFVTKVQKILKHSTGVVL